MAAGTTGHAIAATPASKHEQTLPGRPDQVRVARAFLATALEGCPAAADAILCMSEMATNAILHSSSGKPGGTFTIRAEIHHGDYLWIEVEDGGGPWDTRPPDHERAHGLAIVAALASGWSIEGDASARVIWARFEWPAPGDQPRPGQP
jgi:anti-sigma regulatory factor (Ser/Thr protein kinase)